jgi:DHA1 family multidrug resistance protein-like MFS transporter
LGLRASEHKWTLIALYLVTLIMRASFYVTIAVISSSFYMEGALVGWGVTLVLAIYPLTELSTVSFFGSYSDKIGRKPIFIASLLVTGVAAYLFAIAPFASLALVLAALFGIGAASKVTTTLSMIADCSGEDNRARLMGYYDLSTLVGLAGGYGLGIILIQFGINVDLLLLTASYACLISGLLAVIGMGETRKIIAKQYSMRELLSSVARDKNIQKMIPVYVPIISLYGLFISKAEIIIEEHFSLDAIDFLVLFGILGGSLIFGIIVMGHLSDYLMKRRPFIVTGLIGFGLLAFLLVANADSFEQLWSIWPVLPILGFIAGAFPPAAMAYLTDVSTEEARGSTMGVYSIFFGSGMIIGPIAGEFMYESFGLFLGLGVLVSALILIACIGTYFLDEKHVPPQL